MSEADMIAITTPDANTLDAQTVFDIEARNWLPSSPI
jgi:hypothetical protein